MIPEDKCGMRKALTLTYSDAADKGLASRCWVLRKLPQTHHKGAPHQTKVFVPAQHRGAPAEPSRASRCFTTIRHLIKPPASLPNTLTITLICIRSIKPQKLGAGAGHEGPEQRGVNAQDVVKSVCPGWQRGLSLCGLCFPSNQKEQLEAESSSPTHTLLF